MSREEKKRLSSLKDIDIDYSDIPEITDFDDFVPTNRLSVRLDTDVLFWFKEHSKNPKKTINDILREYIGAHK